MPPTLYDPTANQPVPPRASIGIIVHNSNNYDALNGQGVYVLRDEEGAIRYVGRGDVYERFKEHAAPGSGKEDLVGHILFDNDLLAAQARSLEHELINSLGGGQSVNGNTPLRNKIQGISEGNPDFIELEFEADDDLLIEALRRAGILGS